MNKQEKKFSQIYDKLVKKIYRFIFLKVGASETAEDLTSQVFIKAWNRIRRNQGPKGKNKRIKNLSAYIYQIARAEVAGHYRNESRYQIISTEAVEMVDPNPNPEESRQNQEEMEKIMLCLKKLPEDSQDIVIWSYLDGLSNKEIAAIMQKPENTIRVMKHRALKELKERIEKM